MPFTISSLNPNNELGTANVEITVPAAPIFNEANLIPGESVGPEDLLVSNDGTTDARYFIFADWRPGPNTSPAGAQILADRLNIEITDDDPDNPEVIYSGPVSGLIEQPAAGRELALAGSETLKISASLPSDAGNITQSLALEVDLIFVGTVEEPQP
ncbi:MAG TPA: hypothetical protein GX699_08030 [Firmicutes bacterium]|nr:hypothetical protein [Bacillota bacterium]